jgi:hypothetical protein
VVTVVIGLGELGSLFSLGLLKAGRSVVPVLRDTDRAAVVRAHPAPELALVAVAEADLDSVLAGLPEAWRSRTGLLQNELLPEVWRQHRIENPTVAVIWFEKKPGKPVRELLPSVLHGPRAPLLADALGRVGIATRIAPDDRALCRALVDKNLYILTTNIAGLALGGSVGQIWREQRDAMTAIARDVLELQRALTGIDWPETDLLRELERAIDADPDHAAAGRTAPARLTRALEQAARLGLRVATLRKLAEAS